MDYLIPQMEVETDADEINERLLDDHQITTELLKAAFEPTLVRASAGTGKTYQLTARLLKILLTGASPDTILATTFTRKAAGEILSRVLVSLGHAADPRQPEKLTALRKQVQIEGLPAHVCGQLFHRLLKQIHQLRICTLDSLFSQLARSLPFELDLPPGWQLTDDVEEIWLREIAVSQLIDVIGTSEIETLISMLSRGDVKRNIAREMISVVENTYTMSRQADRNVWDSLQVPTAPDSSDLTRAAGAMRTLEVKQKTLRAQLDKMADHLDARDLSELVEQTLLKNIYVARRDGEAVKYGRSKFPTEIDRDFDILYQAVACQCLSLLRGQNLATGQVAEHYDEVISQLKLGQRLLSFDDVAVRLAKVFANVDLRSLEGRLDGRIDHLLLDEFQDTSPVQWKVLRVLAFMVTDSGGEQSASADASLSSGVAVSRGSRSFFCVGDTKQAIYGWRGGVAEIFDAVDQQIPGIHAKEQNESHRSSKVVLDAVTTAFQNLGRHSMADLPAQQDPADRSLHEALAIRKFAEDFPRHVAAKTLPGYVRFKTGPLLPNKPPSDEDPKGKEMKPSSAEIQAALLEQVTAEIQQLTRRDSAISIAVLTRTNDTVAAMIDSLESIGVDVSGEGGNSLTDCVAVRWILSALMMCEHPGDGRWAYHVGHSPLDECLSSTTTETAANDLRARIENDGLAKTVLWMVKAVLPHCDARDAARLHQFVELATLFSHTARTRLRDFVQLVEVKRIQRPKVAQVRVMTIHQSKGLEFDAVFLPELHKDLIGVSPQCIADLPDLSRPPRGLCRSVSEKQWHFLPERWQHAFGRSVQSRITEAMCLLYVAMTRAKHGLYLFTPPAAKKSFDNKNAASLLYHAWGCEDVDPTLGDQVLWERGDPGWMGKEAIPGNLSLMAEPKPEVKTLSFLPISDPPARNIPV